MTVFPNISELIEETPMMEITQAAKASRGRISL